MLTVTSICTPTRCRASTNEYSPPSPVVVRASWGSCTTHVIPADAPIGLLGVAEIVIAPIIRRTRRKSGRPSEPLSCCQCLTFLSPSRCPRHCGGSCAPTSEWVTRRSLTPAAIRFALLASGPRFIGTQRLGFFGALHTWGRDFTVYHPHVHFVVPGGGVSQDGSRWQAGPANFLLPEKAASTVYRPTTLRAVPSSAMPCRRWACWMR